MPAPMRPHEPNRNGVARPTDDEDADVMRDLRRQAQATRPLTATELQTLLARSTVGDRRSEDRVVAAHLDMVIRLAADRGGNGLTVPDLVQEGSIGLVEAVRTFAESGETDFAAFAGARVGAYMDQAIAAEAESVRDAQLLVEAATDYERTELLMRRELHRAPTPRELAEKLEWTVDRTNYVARIVADARRRHDEELLEFVDPEAMDFGDDDERAG